VTAPEVLTEKALTDYLANPQNGASINSFKLKCTPIANAVVPKAMTLVFGNWTDSDWNSIQLHGWEKEPVTMLAVGYHTRDESWVAQNYLPGTDPLPRVINRELERKDGVVRMAGMTRSGDALLLNLKLSRPIRGGGPFTWPGKNDWPSILFSREVVGTLSISDGKTVDATSRFTTSFDSIEFNRWMKK
jgi:hypothetical protein